MSPKQWKPFEEQLVILKSRSLEIDNDAAALDYLERIGYYRLSGYWYSFRHWLEKHASLVHRARREPFIKHYVDNYGRSLD